MKWHFFIFLLLLPNLIFGKHSHKQGLHQDQLDTELDGTVITYTYNSASSRWEVLKEEIYPDGTISSFIYDHFVRLIHETKNQISWDISYDDAQVIISYYDPEEEFQEFGIKCGDKTFRKLYGSNTCNAIIDDTDTVSFLQRNAFGQLAAVISNQEILYSKNLPSAYGTVPVYPHIPSIIIIYAQTLNQLSKSQDPISPPNSLDPYIYANGDPINYQDLDRHFTSPIYQAAKPIIMLFLLPFDISKLLIKPSSFLLNKTASFLANYELTPSSNYQVGHLDLPRGAALGFTNGIVNTLDQAKINANYLSDFAMGAKVYGTYNATNTFPFDVYECIMGHSEYHSPTVQHIKNKWNHFISTSEPWMKFFETCHSGGATHVKNALLESPESVRQRIIVLAINPAVIIPKALCYKSFNYMSGQDFITLFDIPGLMNYGDQLNILNPHPEAENWDHDFLSPTFSKVIHLHTTDYLRNYGGIK